MKTFNVILKGDKKRNERKELLFGVISGLMLGLSFPPIPFYPLLFAAFIPYLKVLEKRSTLASINRFTYFTIFVYNLITLYWVGSWQPDTDPFLMIAGVALLFFNPCVFLIPSSLYYLAYKRFGRETALYLFPFFWVVVEYLYSLTDFRFPWLTLGHSLAYFHSFIQIADTIGSFGLGILVLYINIFFYVAYKNYVTGEKYYRSLMVGILLLVIPILYGVIKINQPDEVRSSIKVGVIQPNLNPWEKWEAGSLNEQLDLYLSLSEKEIENGAQLLILPETALPVYLLSGGYQSIVNRIHKFCDTNNVNLMTGMPYATFYYDSTKAPEEAKRTKSGTYYTSYNSIIVFEPGSDKVPMYGKVKLVPFGEKVPFVDYIPFLGDLIKWNVGISSWNEGKEQKVFEINIDSTQHKIGGVICIESIYPRFVAGFVKNGAELIAVVTNDSWYGNSSGPYQHKAMSVLRTVENRRSVVRSANGGISCVIDKKGNTLIDTKMFTRTSFTYDVELNSEETIYTKTAYWLPVFSLIVSLFIMFAFIINKIHKKKND